MPNKNYHYTECGLDNVIIQNAGFGAEDDNGEQIVKIPALGRLHKAIAEGLVNQPGTLSGAEIRFLRTEMGMTQTELARLIHRDMQSIGRWERAESPLEPALDIVIRQIAAEKLQVKVPESIIELCMQVTPQASANQITIDHVDDPLCPYRPAA